jgi:hypothetical protein
MVRRYSHENARLLKFSTADPAIRARIQSDLQEAMNQLSVAKEAIDKLRTDEASMIEDQKEIAKQQVTFSYWLFGSYSIVDLGSYPRSQKENRRDSEESCDCRD